MKDTAYEYCRILLDVLEAQGVKDIIASPGSRNAPLLISCSYRDEINTRVVDDERTAAFIALGIAMVSRKPVALICTSGTALYNYAPAVAEAFYQGVPLIIISADRPFHWIGQEDSQTLVQPNALREIVKKSFDIPVEVKGSEVKWYVNRIANEAAILSMDGKMGPVHINIQFEGALSNVEEIDSFEPRRIIQKIPSLPSISPAYTDILTNELAGKKILVVAGYMAPDNKLNRYLKYFSTLPGVKIFCETLSNLHLEGNPYAIDSVISGLDDGTKALLRPDIVISIGGALVSRMLKEYIRAQKCEVWTLGDSYHGVDVFKNLKYNIELPPSIFFRIFSTQLSKYYSKHKETALQLSEYKKLWDKIQKAQITLRSEFACKQGWTELYAFKAILESLPKNYNLFLSNGTCVRYAQLFTERIPHASYSNRGVSGIDGTNATALGCSLAYSDPTLLITGDMSFAYAPQIMGLDFVPDSFKVIVINNKGGGIFRFISPTRYIEHRDKYFCADPNVPVEALAKTYGWTYLAASSISDLNVALNEFYSAEGNVILEIMADEEHSASILRKYMRLNALNQ